MKRKISYFIISIFILLSIFGCKGRENLDKSDKEVILTSFTILADMLRNIVGEEFIVESITKPGSEVHGYQTTPSDLKKGADAFVFIENGFGFELWSNKYVSNLNINRIKISNHLEPIYLSDAGYEYKPNPHAWISPKRGIQYIDIIVDELSDLRPNKREIFEENAKNYKNQIIKIDEDFSNFIKSIEKSKLILVSCEGAFSYLAKDYGFKEAYLWPLNAESSITPKRMKKIINLVNKYEVPSVFCESTVSSEAQLIVVEETDATFGGNLYVDSLSNDDGPASTYIDLLNHNFTIIKNGFSFN